MIIHIIVAQNIVLCKDIRCGNLIILSSGGKLNMQLFDLKGKTAIITGASSGLGEQFARCLSGAGARVLLAARRLDKLNTLAI